MHNLGLDPGTGKTVSFKRTGAKCDGGTARSKMSKSKPLPASYSRLHRVSCSYSGMSSRSVACILSFCPLPGASQSVSFLSHVLIIPIVESSWPAFFPSPSFLQHEHPPSFQPLGWEVAFLSACCLPMLLPKDGTHGWQDISERSGERCVIVTPLYWLLNTWVKYMIGYFLLLPVLFQ